MATQASRDGRLAAVVAELSGARVLAMTRAALIEALGERGLRNAVRSGTLVELLPRVFVVAGRQYEHQVRCHAVLLWGRGRLRISGASALHLATSRISAPRDVHAVGSVPHHAHTPDWLRIRRVAASPAVNLVQGVRCVAPEEALLDAWVRALARDREELLYIALWADVVQPQTLLDLVRATRRLVSREVIVDVLGEFEAGARSPGEVLARRNVFTGPEWAELERRAHFVVGGRDRYPDLVHRRARLVIECDGDAYHGTPRAVAADRERDTDFLEIGYATVRFSFHDLLRRPEWCRRKLRGVIANRLNAA